MSPQENTLISNAALVLDRAVTAAGSGFTGPSISDFFPPAVLFKGTPFELNRIMLIRLLVTVVLVLVFWIGTSRMKVVPGRAQVALEFVINFIRRDVILDTLGEKDGNKWMAVLLTFFFVVLGMNLTAVVPGLQIAGTSVIGLPLVMALVAYVLMIYTGMRRHGWRYWKKELFLPGVPWGLYFLLTPIELLSTFVLRPVTLVLRLLMNMVSGHMLLVLCWSATQFFLLSMLAHGNFLGLLGIGTFAFGAVYILFEIFVAVLQAYVFVFLASIYIQMAVADEH